MNRPMCGTCRFWDARFPQNADLGVCSKAGVIVFGAREAAIVIVDAENLNDPTSDFDAVRTTRYFGCIEHTAPGTHLRTLDMAFRP